MTAVFPEVSLYFEGIDVRDDVLELVQDNLMDLKSAFHVQAVSVLIHLRSALALEA